MKEEIKRGSFVTSVATICKDLNLSPREVRTALDHLKSTNEVTIRTTRKYSVITVVNYDEYQGNDKESDKQATNKRQTSDNNRRNKERNKGKNNNISSFQTQREGYDFEKMEAEMFSKQN